MHIEEDYVNTPTERANMDHFIEERRKKVLANKIPTYDEYKATESELRNVRMQIREYIFRTELDDYEKTQLKELEMEERYLTTYLIGLQQRSINPNCADFEDKMDSSDFVEKLDGKRPCEVRRIDGNHEGHVSLRLYKPGVLIKYCEWNPIKKYCTGRFLIVKVISVIRNVPGLEHGYCLIIDENIAQGGLIS